MALELQSVTYSYFEVGKPVLNQCNARFEAGSVTVLTGPSGCGKSTLLYLAAGIYPHTTGFLRAGRVLVDGQNPDQLPPQKRCALVGMMFQNPELQFCMDTVENELIFCLENRQTPPEEIPAQMADALSFCEIEHLRHRTLTSLSGGERQKAMLCCLTALAPQWLLLDEPFANVDSQSAREIAQKLRQLCDTRGVGILAVDHRLDSWLGVYDTVLYMEESVISPLPPDLPKSLLEEMGIIIPDWPYLQPRPPRRTPGPAALVLEHLSLELGGKPVLNNLNATFDAGRVHAIVGESGCGKSTLFGVLSGQYRCKGTLTLPGADKKVLGHMGFVTQSPQDQFVSDTVYGEVFLGLSRQDKAGAAQQTEAILRRIGLWRYRDVSPYMLSQGQQRRLGVAALMAYNCRVLVCDEPTYAQDRRNTLAILEGLCRQVDEHGLCLIFSTHDRRLAEDFADEIWFMEGGSLHALH